jgi:ribonuclease HI
VTSTLKYIIHVDGASRGNPGEASFGFVILKNSGEIVHQESGYIGRATNNVAEYTALVRALEFAVRKKIKQVEIRSDSQLLVRQLTGLYKIKSEPLARLYHRCKELLANFEEFQIQHVPREQNQLADKLANFALDQREKWAGKQA